MDYKIAMILIALCTLGGLSVHDDLKFMYFIFINAIILAVSLMTIFTT